MREGLGLTVALSVCRLFLTRIPFVYLLVLSSRAMLLHFCAYPNNTDTSNQPKAYWASAAGTQQTHFSRIHVSRRIFQVPRCFSGKSAESSCFAGLVPTVNVGVNSLPPLPASRFFTTLSSTSYGGNIQRPLMLVGFWWAPVVTVIRVTARPKSVWLLCALASVWLLTKQGTFCRTIFPKAFHGTAVDSLIPASASSAPLTTHSVFLV